MTRIDRSSDSTKTSKRGSRQKRGGATRLRILNAAAAEFSAKGFEGATMRTIARQCGVELGLVQHHFGNKIGLWHAVLDHVMGAYHENAQDILRNSDPLRPAETLCKLIEALVRRGAADPIWVGLMSHARIEATVSSTAMQDRLRPSSSQLIALIGAAQSDGTFVQGDPGLLLYNLVGAALRVFMTAADLKDVLGRSASSPATVNEQIDNCIRLFMPTFSRRRARARVASTSAGRDGALQADRAGPGVLYLLGVAELAVRRRMDDALTALGITRAQMVALLRIANNQSLSSAHLARILDVSPQSANLSVKALQDKELIRRTVDAKQRRALRIELTPSGERIVVALRDVIRSSESSVLNGLPMNDHTDLHRILMHIVEQNFPAALADWVSLPLDPDAAPFG